MDNWNHGEQSRGYGRMTVLSFQYSQNMLVDVCNDSDVKQKFTFLCKEWRKESCKMDRAAAGSSAEAHAPIIPFLLESWQPSQHRWPTPCTPAKVLREMAPRDLALGAHREDSAMRAVICGDSFCTTLFWKLLTQSLKVSRPIVWPPFYSSGLWHCTNKTQLDLHSHNLWAALIPLRGSHKHFQTTSNWNHR